VAGKKARKARAVAKARPKAKARKNPKATTTQALPKTVVSQNRERHDRREGDERKRGSTQSIHEVACPPYQHSRQRHEFDWHRRRPARWPAFCCGRFR